MFTPPAMRVIELGDKADIGEGWGVCETETGVLRQQRLVGGKPLGHPMVEPIGLSGRVHSHLGFEVGHDPQVVHRLDVHRDGVRGGLDSRAQLRVGWK